MSGYVNEQSPVAVFEDVVVNDEVQAGKLKLPGTAPAAGYVGEKIPFTARSVTATTWTANTSPLITLEKGVYAVTLVIEAVSGAGLTRASAGYATNSSNDSTGLMQYGFLGAGTGSGIRFTLSDTITVASSTSYYAKGLTEGALVVLVVSGHATRIA